MTEIRIRSTADDGYDAPRGEERRATYALLYAEAHTSAILTCLTCPTSVPLRAGLITSLLTASFCSALNRAAATPGLFKGHCLTAA